MQPHRLMYRHRRRLRDRLEVGDLLRNRASAVDRPDNTTRHEIRAKRISVAD
jgi:hypothetical protein